MECNCVQIYEDAESRMEENVTLTLAECKCLVFCNTFINVVIFVENVYVFFFYKMCAIKKLQTCHLKSFI